MVVKIKALIKSSPLFPIIIKARKEYAKKKPISYTKYQYKKFYNAPLDLDNPEKLSEKIQWLKLFVYPKNDKVVLAADKYTLHQYLDGKEMGKYRVPYIKVFDDANELDFEKLPNQFVIKKTNASGFNLIVKNKDELNISSTKKLLEKWMNTDFGMINTEFHYSAAQPKIICESFLNLGDEYRFFMVSGEIAFIQVIIWDWETNKDGKKNKDDAVIAGHKKHYRLHFDKNLKLLWSDKGAPQQNISLPNYWKELLEVSKIIGQDFPVVRVDFNDVNGKPKITELTFTPASGFLDILKHDKLLDLELGSRLELSGFQ